MSGFVTAAEPCAVGGYDEVCGGGAAFPCVAGVANQGVYGVEEFDYIGLFASVKIVYEEHDRFIGAGHQPAKMSGNVGEWVDLGLLEQSRAADGVPQQELGRPERSSAQDASACQDGDTTPRDLLPRFEGGGMHRPDQVGGNERSHGDYDESGEIWRTGSSNPLHGFPYPDEITCWPGLGPCDFSAKRCEKRPPGWRQARLLPGIEAYNAKIVVKARFEKVE
nr:hypothetical protein [Nocardia asiatica]